VLFSFFRLRIIEMRWLPVACVALTLVSACSKEEPKNAQRPPVDVTVIKIQPKDTHIVSQFDGQTVSSRQVVIMARVAGFLDKRVYEEGSMVKAGQVMFLQDPKPFKAQLAAAKGALAAQDARWLTSKQNLARVKPLVALNALSQKDLDDAIGSERASAAAVQTATADVEQAQLNLGYTTITSPLAGRSSYARVQEGAYVNAENSLLTYVDQVDPIYVNFSLSENQLLRVQDMVARGMLIQPKDMGFEVKLNLADGSEYAQSGRITFADADFNKTTGTFLLRATLPNPKGELRPGQFVRVSLLGSQIPNAILVPQEAILQGAKGHFVIVVDKDSKAQIRPVQVGAWYNNQWFIEGGLSAGDVLVVNGMAKLAPGAPVKTTEALDAAAAIPASAKQ
jgi:membrane fusion protein (multidrug efflux system)